MDGARLASLPARRVEGLGLREGLVLTPESRARLDDAVAAERAYNAAVRMVTARPRAVYEMLHRLRAKGHGPRAAAEAVGRLEDAGLLDDEQFARHFVRVRTERGLGPSRLLSELLQRGVDRAEAERAIAEVHESEGVDVRAQVETLARKRASQLRHVPREARFRRVVGYLRRRGHRGSDLLQLVRRIVTDDQD